LEAERLKQKIANCLKTLIGIPLWRGQGEDFSLKFKACFSTANCGGNTFCLQGLRQAQTDNSKKFACRLKTLSGIPLWRGQGEDFSLKSKAYFSKPDCCGNTALKKLKQ
jgi:hypothetical protein